MIYYSENNLLIRSMEIDDARIIDETYLSYGWHSSLEEYENYYKEQEDNKRKVFVAVYEGKVCGLCTLVMNPAEGPWVGKGYPEIVDLGVFRHAQNKGIGNKLLDVVEQEAAKVSDTIFLAVGLHSGYGQPKGFMSSADIFRTVMVFGIKENRWSSMRPVVMMMTCCFLCLKNYKSVRQHPIFQTACKVLFCFVSAQYCACTAV